MNTHKNKINYYYFYLAISCSLFTRQTNQKSTRSFGWVSWNFTKNKKSISQKFKNNQQTENTTKCKQQTNKNYCIPWSNWNMFPQALATAAILAMTGKLWMTKETSFFWLRAKAWACPRRPNPVISVAPCALYLCIKRAPIRFKRAMESIPTRKKNNQLYNAAAAGQNI